MTRTYSQKESNKKSTFQTYIENTAKKSIYFQIAQQVLMQALNHQNLPFTIIKSRFEALPAQNQFGQRRTDNKEFLKPTCINVTPSNSIYFYTDLIH